MIEYENYGKLESLAELENAIEMGLDFYMIRGIIFLGEITNHLYANVQKEWLSFLIPQNFCYRGMKWVTIL